MRFLMVTGLSGAGKKTAMRYLEDMSALCVDNLPPRMMMKCMEACQTAGRHNMVCALAVDVRSGDFFDAKAVAKLITEMREVNYRIETVFLEASDEVLVQRYKESRREHPLADESTSLTEAIAKERSLLEPLRETANYVIETTAIKPRQLQKELQRLCENESTAEALRIELMSFGFKRGLPRQSDLVFDVRFLPNPYYIEELCRNSGLDPDVRDIVLNHPVTEEFLTRVTGMLDFLLPHYREEGKHRLVIAIGCTGGAHRSVAIAEAIGAHLRAQGYPVGVNHRDIDVEQARWKTSAE